MYSGLVLILHAYSYPYPSQPMYARVNPFIFNSLFIIHVHRSPTFFATPKKTKTYAYLYYLKMLACTLTKLSKMNKLPKQADFLYDFQYVAEE